MIYLQNVYTILIYYTLIRPKMNDINFHIFTKLNDRLSEYFSFDGNKNKTLKIIIKKKEDFCKNKKVICCKDNETLIIISCEEEQKNNELHKIYCHLNKFNLELKVFGFNNSESFHKIVMGNNLKEFKLTCNEYNNLHKYKFYYFPDSLEFLNLCKMCDFCFMPNKIKKIEINEPDIRSHADINKNFKQIKKVPYKLTSIKFSNNIVDSIKINNKKILVIRKENKKSSNLGPKKMNNGRH